MTRTREAAAEAIARADLWFEGNCLVGDGDLEPCESCGIRGRTLMCRDWRRRFCNVIAVGAGHTSLAECGPRCESWWEIHTPARCRAFKRGMEAVRRQIDEALGATGQARYMRSPSCQTTCANVCDER